MVISLEPQGPGDQTYWLGLYMAAMTVTNMLSGLDISRVMDWRIRIFNTGLYSLAITQHVIMVSRIVSGLEKSIIIVYLTDTCRSTSIAERTPVYLVFNIPRQVNCNELKKERIYLYFLAVNIQLATLNQPGHYS